MDLEEIGVRENGFTVNAALNLLVPKLVIYKKNTSMIA